jgi:glycosyltransferase involved in cell wall biosynthesis
MPKITVCIPTLDRAVPLAVGLDALLKSEGIEATEIIVVNNGAGEATREVVERFAHRLPVRYVRHDKPSVGEVLNRGWREAAAEWLAYIDDDSIVYPTWLPAILEDIQIVRPDCFAMAGNIDSGPEPLDLPKWCHPNVAMSAFTNLYLGDHPHYLSMPEGPVGNNFIIRKALLDRHEGFAPGLRTYWENHIIFLGYHSGGSCYFDPRIHVIHRPAQERITKGWVLNKLHNSGMDYQHMLSLLKGYPDCPPEYDFFLKLPMSLLKMVAAWLLQLPAKVMAFRCVMIFQWGRVEKKFFGRQTTEYSTFKGK